MKKMSYAFLSYIRPWVHYPVLKKQEKERTEKKGRKRRREEGRRKEERKEEREGEGMKEGDALETLENVLGSLFLFIKNNL
jgi:hypothetical protein